MGNAMGSEIAKKSGFLWQDEERDLDNKVQYEGAHLAPGETKGKLRGE